MERRKVHWRRGGEEKESRGEEKKRRVEERRRSTMAHLRKG